MSAPAGLSVIVCGGAGFIGSQIVDRFLMDGATVTVLDGLLPHTGGRLEHVAPTVREELRGRLIPAPIEEVLELPALLQGSDLVVDAMGWTRHTLALADPLYDLRLNLGAHLWLLNALRGIPEGQRPRVIYLGSRHEYGQPPAGERIHEDTPFRPRDVQSVHKAAADQHFSLAARQGLTVASLRFGNTFGPRQPLDGPDIGLVGGFMRDALAGQILTTYDDERGERRRDCVYAPDIAEAVVRLARTAWAGYQPLHLLGHDLTIGSLVDRIVRLAGSGAVQQERMPPHIQAMEVGMAPFTSARLETLIGAPPRTELDEALAATLADLRPRLGSSTVQAPPSPPTPTPATPGTMTHG